MYDYPHAVEELKQPRKHPTPERVEAIKDALKHFTIIDLKRKIKYNIVKCPIIDLIRGD